MKPGDQLDWECVIENNNVSATSPAPYKASAITFDNAVYTGEMCNLFGVYGSTDGRRGRRRTPDRSGSARSPSQRA